MKRQKLKVLLKLVRKSQRHEDKLETKSSALYVTRRDLLAEAAMLIQAAMNYERSKS